VINHTDINPNNILVLLPSNKIHLIDFEWVGLASDYWDYANFIRETNLNYKNISWDKYIANFDINILKQYIYITSVFAYLWTFNMPQTPKIIKYRSLTKKQILDHYNDVK
jgi:thiamine kinase-like enzyme